MPKDSALVVKNLTKLYDIQKEKLSVLINCSFRVTKNEFVSIIGPNGCGKSTLLKIIAGIIAPTSGSILIDENTPSYMPQDHALLPWRSVKDNLFLPMDIKKIKRFESEKKIEAMLGQFGLLAFANAYPDQLSGGMQQKVALLRTILCNPSFLLLDEPFASLDALTRLSMQEWLLSLWKKTHASVVFVTHDIREAILLSDTIYVMSKRPGTIKKKYTISSKKSIQLEKELFSLLVDKPNEKI